MIKLGPPPHHLSSGATRSSTSGVKDSSASALAFPVDSIKNANFPPSPSRLNLNRRSLWGNGLGLLLAGGALSLLITNFSALLSSGSTSRGDLLAEELLFNADSTNPIPPLLFSAWLFACRRRCFDHPARPADRAFAGLLLFASTSAFGWSHYTSAPHLLKPALMLLLAGLTTFASGVKALRSCAAPIAILWFCTAPSPVLLSAITFPLQLATAQVAATILTLLGVPVELAGERLWLATHAVMVIETCAGLRAIVSLSMISILANQVLDLKGFRSAILILSAPMIAFIANSARIVALAVWPTPPEDHNHLLQGLSVFGGSLLVLFALGLALDRHRPTRAPTQTSPSTESKARYRWHETFAVAALVLFAMLGISRLVAPWPTERVRLETPTEFLDRTLVDLPSERRPVDWMFMGSIRPLSHDYRAVEIDGREVQIFLAIPDAGNLQNAFITRRLAWPESGIAPRTSSDLPPLEGRLHSRKTVFASAGAPVLSYSWYQNSSGLVSEWLRHTFALERSPFARSAGMSAIRISTVAEGHNATAILRAENRVRVVYERLLPALATYGGSAKTR